MPLWVAVIAWGITLVGWITTHILTLRAQRKSLLNQVYNSARLEITQSIRECQDWHSALAGVVGWLLAKLGMEREGVLVDWQQVHGEAMPLVGDARSTRWLLALEEYEILFPKTRAVRIDLARRNGQITAAVSALLMSLMISTEREAAVEGTKPLKEAALDMISLLEDLRVYLQNETLHAITGNRVPYRQPPDATVPRIVVKRKGDLTIEPAMGPDNNQLQRTSRPGEVEPARR